VSSSVKNDGLFTDVDEMQSHVFNSKPLLYFD